MTALRSNISALSSEDVMLFELLARTGMRPSEAYQIREEFNEAGIRYVIVGAKTDSSERRVPQPLRVRLAGPLSPSTDIHDYFSGRQSAQKATSQAYTGQIDAMIVATISTRGTFSGLHGICIDGKRSNDIPKDRYLLSSLMVNRPSLAAFLRSSERWQQTYLRPLEKIVFAQADEC
jgi:hypothetical protein